MYPYLHIKQHDSLACWHHQTVAVFRQVHFPERSGGRFNGSIPIQTKVKNCSLTHFTFSPDFPAVTLNDTPY